MFPCPSLLGWSFSSRHRGEAFQAFGSWIKGNKKRCMMASHYFNGSSIVMVFRIWFSQTDHQQTGMAPCEPWVSWHEDLADYFYYYPSILRIKWHFIDFYTSCWDLIWSHIWTRIEFWSKKVVQAPPPGESCSPGWGSRSVVSAGRVWRPSGSPSSSAHPAGRPAAASTTGVKGKDLKGMF